MTPVPRPNKTKDQLLSVDVNCTPYNPLINFSPCENSETMKMSNILLHSEKCSVSSTTDIPINFPAKAEQLLPNNIPTMVPHPNLTSTLSITKILENITSKKDSNKSYTAPLKSVSLFEAKANNTSRDDILLDLQSEFSDPDEVQNNVKLHSNSDNKNDPLFDMLTEMEFGGVLEVPRNSVKNLYSRKRKISTSLNEPDKSKKTSKPPKDCLDARLTAMGLLDDDNDKDEISVEMKQKKSNWYLEFIAQSCNLTRIMSCLNQKQQMILNTKFEKLFGLPNEPDTELNEENIRVCRKRIASVVVAELTPLYQAKRIGSRHLFKFLAKHATNTLMQQSYAPGK